MYSEDPAHLSRQLEPYMVGLIERVVGGATRRTASPGGTVAAHDLGGPSHEGILRQEQAPWAFTRVEAEAFQFHDRLHSITSVQDHGVTGAIYSVIGLPAANTLGVLPTSDNGSAGNVLMRSGANGGLRAAYFTAPLLNTAGGAMTIAPSGDLVIGPTSKETVPAANYAHNLGQLEKKWLTIHGAELWIENLVVEEVRATMGGRLMVIPTNELIADLAIGATTIDVKYNNFTSGDRIYLEFSGQVEWISVGGTPTSLGNGYRYSVTRNLDGSGQNYWFAGAGIANTGQTGNGWIDQYARYGMPKAGQSSTQRAGPTIVGNVRLSSTYNDFAERWAAGNLKGLYDYASNIYGFAAGNPAAAWTGLDATNGLRMMYGANKRLDITPAGVMSFYNSLGNPVIQFDASGNAYFKNRLEIDTGGVLAILDGTSGDALTLSYSDGITFRNDTTDDYAALDERRAVTWKTVGAVMTAQLASYQSGSVNGLQLYSYSTTSGSAFSALRAIQSDKVYSPTAAGEPRFEASSSPSSDLARVIAEKIQFVTNNPAAPNWTFQNGHMTMGPTAAIPGTPASGYAVIYVNGGKVIIKDDTGATTQLN